MKTVAAFMFAGSMVASSMAYSKGMTQDALLLAVGACAMMLMRISFQLEEAKK